MRSIAALLLLVFNAHFAFGQLPKWANYVNDNKIYDIAVDGDEVWIGSEGGLTKWNRSTEVKESFLPTTTGFGGFGVRTIAVAPDGTKWIGGAKGGLLRFDGTNWERYYYINTGDTLGIVYKIKIAPNGDVWFKSAPNDNCMECATVFKFDGNTFTNMTKVLDDLDTDSNNINIRDFDIAPNGDLYAITYINTYHYNEQGLFFQMTPFLSQYENMWGIIADNNGNVYLRTGINSGTRIYRYYDGALPWVEYMGSNIIPAICQHWFVDSQNNLWINFAFPNSLERFAKFDGTDWQFWTVDELPFEPASPNTVKLQTVDDEGHWWVIDALDGDIHKEKVFEVDGADWKSYSTELVPIGGNLSFEVAFDCENKAWVGGDGFLSRFDGTQWSDLTETEFNNTVKSDNFNAMLLDEKNCVLWIGHDNFGYRSITKFDGTNFYHYNTSSITAREIALDVDGSLWFSSGTKGLGHLTDSTLVWYNTSTYPLSNNKPSAIAVDKEGGVWVADIVLPKVFRFFNDIWTEITPPSLSSNIKWMFVDKDGVVWMGNGQQKPFGYDGTNWQVMQNAPSTAYKMAQDADGSFWFGGPRVSHVDGGNIEYFNIIDHPLGDNGVYYQVRVDPFNNKWLLHDTGISVFNNVGVNYQLLNPSYSVEGRVFFDVNQDSMYADVGEPGLPGMPIMLLPDSITTYSTIGGYYKLTPNSGNYQISVQPLSPFVPTTPNPLDLLMVNSSQSGFDFGVWRPTPPDSIGLDLTLGFARCSQTTNVWVTPSNLAPLSEIDGKVTLAYDPALQFLSAMPAPISNQSHVLTWNVTELPPYQPISIRAVFDNPAADHAGEWMDFAATFAADSSGLSLSHSDATELRCSYDPNDKKATPTGESVNEYSLLGDALDYTIRFQNKGNDTAFLVVIRDTLDADLDPASFQLVSSSHPVRVTLEQGRVLTFYFESINLLWESYNEPASHGFVKYRIAPKPGLPDPTEIHNTAHIYFDLNPAIVTNTTENILVETLPFLATGEALPSGNLLVYPNPTDGSFYLDASEVQGPWSASIHDVYGRTMQVLQSNTSKAKVEGLAKGFYFILVKQGGKLYTAKVVVE